MKCLRLIATTASCFLLLSASAQFNVKLPVPSAFRNDIQKVVEDYPHQYASVRGKVIAKNPQTVEYASNVKPEGAQETMIVQYSSRGKDIYTWQTTLLATEDFEEAAKKYKWLYSQLKGMNVKYVADMYTLRGEYSEPDESLKFITSILTPSHPPAPLAKLKLEVAMNFEFPEWKVSLLIYDKEREDEERGEEVDGK